MTEETETTAAQPAGERRTCAEWLADRIRQPARYSLKTRFMHGVAMRLCKWDDDTSLTADEYAAGIKQAAGPKFG